MPPTNEDITRLHERFDNFLETQTKMAVDIGKIQKTLELTPKPATRPCSFFVAHVKEHEKVKSLWQTPLVSMCFDFGRMAIVAVLTWIFCHKE